VGAARQITVAKVVLPFNASRQRRGERAWRMVLTGTERGIVRTSIRPIRHHYVERRRIVGIIGEGHFERTRLVRLQHTVGIDTVVPSGADELRQTGRGVGALHKDIARLPVNDGP
jgi:hypothetical protein